MPAIPEISIPDETEEQLAERLEELEKEIRKRNTFHKSSEKCN